MFGAGEGNRTPVSTLGRSRSTIELHLHCLSILPQPTKKSQVRFFCFYDV